jgi:hypothetical protein
VFALPFFGELVSGLFVRRRAVSEIVGAVLIAMITIAMSVAYVVAGRSVAQSQTLSMVDLIRAAERRQRQLLSLTYYYKYGNNLDLYLYNYGNENATIKKLFVGNFEVTDSRVIGLTVVPKELKYVTFRCDQSGSLDVLLLTEEGGIFIWKINV